jgi:HlyD family secretion protein
VKLTIDSRPGEVFAGTVSRVAPYVVDEEAQNRTLEIEVSIDDAGVAVSLLPGTSADAEVVLEDRQDVLRVPSSALLGDASVLLLRGGELVEVAVELGLRNWKFAEITSGLEEGDQVVIALDRIEIKSGIRAVAMNENGDSSK